MTRLKGIFWFWAAIMGAEALVVVICLVILAFSPVLRERMWEGLAVPPSPVLRAFAADRLKNYPSRASAITLIALLNIQDKEGFGQVVSAEALSSLRELSGESFNPPDHQGDGFTVPTSPESWSEMVARLNCWALDAFGPDALSSLARMGFNPNVTITATTGPDGHTTFDARPGDTTGETTDGGDSASATGSEVFNYTLPGGSDITWNYGDTAGLSGRLSDAGVAVESRFARAMMNGDTIAFREVMDDMVQNVRDGDTAEAAVIYHFFDHSPPWVGPAGEDRPADDGQTEEEPTGSDSDVEVTDGGSEAE